MIFFIVSHFQNQVSFLKSEVNAPASLRNTSPWSELLGILRQKDEKAKQDKPGPQSKVTVSLGNLVRPYLKIKSKKRPRGKTSIPSTTEEGEGGVEERNEETLSILFIF